MSSSRDAAPPMAFSVSCHAGARVEKEWCAWISPSLPSNSTGEILLLQHHLLFVSTERTLAIGSRLASRMENAGGRSPIR